MPGTARPQGSHGDFISHVVGTRIRVVGSGNLKQTLFSQDKVVSQVLAPSPMAATARLSTFTLANFTEQRASLEIKTTVINDDFRINRVILFTKVVATMEPA